MTRSSTTSRSMGIRFRVTNLTSIKKQGFKVTSDRHEHHCIKDYGQFKIAFRFRDADLMGNSPQNFNRKFKEAVETKRAQANEAL